MYHKLGKITLLSCGFFAVSASNLYAQDAFDCSASANEILVYCNDFETRNGGFSVGSYYDMSFTSINTAYTGTEVKDSAVTVNGVAGPAFIGQNFSVETLLLNNYNYQTNHSSNQYAIGLQQSESSTIGTDAEGGDLLAFTFDVINPDTGRVAPFIELQIDFAPAFLTDATVTPPGTVFRTTDAIWGEVPRMKVSVYDGQLTAIPQVNNNSELEEPAVLGTPLALDSQIIMGGAPAPVTANLQNVPVNFVRSTVYLDTSGITDANGTATILLDVLQDSKLTNDPTNRNFPRRYAVFDNLKISILKNNPNLADPARIPAVGLVGLFGAVIVLLGLARRRFVK